MTIGSGLTVQSEPDGLEMSGTRHDFEAFANWLRSDDSVADYRLSGCLPAAGRADVIGVVAVRTGSSPGLATVVEGHSKLVIEGTPNERLWLAALLEDFSLTAPVGVHFHLEYYPRHVVLRPGSQPIVLSLVRRSPHGHLAFNGD